jgi:DNA-binding response OmpR family regulator
VGDTRRLVTQPGIAARRILIVDDDEEIRLLMTEIFDRAGYSATAVSSAEAALECLESLAPDCVLLDVQLPGVSGYEACVQMREISGDDLPIIFLSGTKMDSLDRTAGIMMGADDYVVKPVSIDELLARVRRSIRQVTPTNPLTKRELEVLSLARTGNAHSAIAGALFISPKTVASHLENIFKKLHVGSKAEAVAMAEQQNLFV